MRALFKERLPGSNMCEKSLCEEFLGQTHEIYVTRQCVSPWAKADAGPLVWPYLQAAPSSCSVSFWTWFSETSTLAESSFHHPGWKCLCAHIWPIIVSNWVASRSDRKLQPLSGLVPAKHRTSLTCRLYRIPYMRALLSRNGPLW
jgi:hypothetical protein